MNNYVCGGYLLRFHRNEYGAILIICTAFSIWLSTLYVLQYFLSVNTCITKSLFHVFHFFCGCAATNLKGLHLFIFSNELIDGDIEFHGSCSQFAFLWDIVTVVKAPLHSLTHCSVKIILL